MKRVIFDIVLFLSIFVLPWWASVFFVIIGIFIFDNFYEFIISGIIFFSLYRAPSDIPISSPIIFSLSISTIYIIIQYIKSNIIFYKNEI
jgi:hypothetical protein